MPQGSRFASLDALRGLAILGMAWSGMLPETLPAWMYHAQSPPPNHQSDPTIPGVTWVDLVFPFFLFSMGAAIPLALTRRLERGEKWFQVAWVLLIRGMLLGAFAIFGEHLRAGEWSDEPNANTYWVVFCGFFLLVLMFIRWPQKVPPVLGKAVTAMAWIGATLLIAFHNYPDGMRGFANYRNDVILMVLANVAVSGGLIWLATRCRPLLRAGVMIAVMFVFLSSSAPDSLGKQIWDFTPLQFLRLDGWPYKRFFPIFYHFEYHKYLLIVLPGTFCGDLVLRSRGEDDSEGHWVWARYLAVALLGIAASVVACLGFYAHDDLATCWELMAIGAGMVVVTARPLTSAQRLISQLVRFGAAILFLGLLALPLDGGIKKDEATLGYFLVTAGLATLFLAALQSLTEGLKLERWLRAFTYPGMNPILAYCTITNFVMGLSGLTRYSELLGLGPLYPKPWVLAVVDGGLKTLVVAFVAAICTERAIFLRT